MEGERGPGKPRDFAVGIVLLVCVVLLWVSSGFLMSVSGSVHVLFLPRD